MSVQIGDKLPHFIAVKQDGTVFDSHSNRLLLRALSAL